MKELPHFNIGSSYGSCQDWFTDYMMNKGGCGAVTACDSCIYLAKYKNMQSLYPYNPDNVTKRNFLDFAEIMRPYLSPRANGIDTTAAFIDGFSEYIKLTREKNLKMTSLEGGELFLSAKSAVKKQIDNGFPIPYLLLHHKDKEFDFYEWHWFILNGYEEFEDTIMVKAVTYGNFRWLDLARLWDTGYSKKGGMILFEN